MRREHASSNTPWESEVGYSRAIIYGSTIYVSGTTATGADGEVDSKGDAYDQTVQAIKNIRSALRQLNADLGDVVRTRIFVTDIDRWKQIGKAHGEYFGDIRPATSMVEVSQLIDPDMLVEIEAVAVVGE